MLTVFLIIFFILTISIVLMAVLPVRTKFSFDGGTDRNTDILGTFLFFSGTAGFGIRYLKKDYYISIIILSRKIAEFKTTPLVKKIKSKTQNEKPAAVAEKPKEPFSDRVKKYYNRSVSIIGEIKRVKKEFFEIFRFERFYNEITLGLGDPATTGLLSGVIFAINGVLPERFRVYPKYDFTGKTFGCSVQFEAAVSMVSLWKFAFKNISRYRSGKYKKKENSASITI